MPRLGFAIPTYRRPDQLVECVRSIVRSADGVPVAVAISDDSCDDTNREAVAEIRRIFPGLLYERNEANLGIDGNILRSVDLSPCEYVWIMGEDDRVLPGGVEKIVGILENEAPETPFLYVNYTAVDDDFRVVLRARSLEISRDDLVRAEKFFSEFAWSMGFIGACVVRKELWDSVRSDRYTGTYFAHAGTILEYLHGREVYMVAEPLVLNRCATPRTFSWVNDAYEVLDGWSRLMEALEPVYGKELCGRSLRSFEEAHGLRTLKFLCYMRADGVYDAGVYRERVRGGPYGRWHKAAARLIAGTDPRVFRAARALLYRWRSISGGSTPPLGRGPRLPGERAGSSSPESS